MTDAKHIDVEMINIVAHPFIGLFTVNINRSVSIHDEYTLMSLHN